MLLLIVRLLAGVRLVVIVAIENDVVYWFFLLLLVENSAMADERRSWNPFPNHQTHHLDVEPSSSAKKLTRKCLFAKGRVANQAEYRDQTVRLVSILSLQQP
jgi:hypothetical protein